MLLWFKLQVALFTPTLLLVQCSFLGAYYCATKKLYFQQLKIIQDRLVLDASGNRTMQLAIYAVSKHRQILQIIATGAEALYRPLSYVKFINLYNSEDKMIQMEVARSYYTADQLTNLNTYLINSYRSQLSVYNFSQRTTIMENISRHLCYSNINEFSV